MRNNLIYACELIEKADGILITAGAGMSVDSGLPDFRSMGGFWNAYPPFQKMGLDFAQVANPTFYQYHPEQAFWFFASRLNTYRNTQPHQGYQILKRWAEIKENGYFVFTSNVDGHFQKAGYLDKRVYEVHGTLERMQCLQNCQDRSWSSQDFHPIVDNEHYCILSEKPHCPDCGGYARQNVMMFDDHFYCDHYYQTKFEILQQWIKQVKNIVVIELGAGKAIPTVRRFSERMAKQNRGGLIRINPMDAGVPKEHFLGLDMKALDALSQIDELLRQREKN